MSWWGKLVGGAFGFMLGGPLGALIGAAMLSANVISTSNKSLR